MLGLVTTRLVGGFRTWWLSEEIRTCPEREATLLWGGRRRGSRPGGLFLKRGVRRQQACPPGSELPVAAGVQTWLGAARAEMVYGHRSAGWALPGKAFSPPSTGDGRPRCDKHLHARCSTDRKSQSSPAQRFATAVLRWKSSVIDVCKWLTKSIYTYMPHKLTHTRI